MRKVCCIASSLFLVLTGHVLAQPANNIAVVEIYYPAGRIPLGIPTMVAADFRNTGTNDQTNVPVIATISRNGTVVYRDTQYINNWVSGEYRDTSFRDFTPTTKLPYLICFSAELDTDEDANDNSMCHTFDTRYLKDVHTVAVTHPVDTSIKPGSEIRVKARFTNQSVEDLFEIRARVQIKRCSDGVLVFQADSIPGIPELYVDSTVEFRYQAQQGKFDTRNLLPGCYKVAAISLLSDDVDRTNDTAFSTFTILPFNNNIKVDSVLSPVKNLWTLPNVPLAPTIRFKNTGINTQTNVPLSVTIRDSSGQLILSDLVTANNWVSNEARTIVFKSCTPTKIGKHTLTVVLTLSNDEWHGDDTVRMEFVVNGRRNISMLEITVPVADEKIHTGTGYTATVRLKAEANTISKYSSVPIHLAVYRCSDNTLMYRVDTTVASINADDKEITYQFSSASKYYDPAELPFGRYRISIWMTPLIDEILADNGIEHNFKVVDTSIQSNITTSQVLDPADGSSAFPAANPIGINVRYTNNGVKDQVSIPVGVIIHHQSGKLVYHDSSIITTLDCLDEAIVKFSDFTMPPTPDLGWYTLVAYSQLPDDLPADDTLVSMFARGYPYDVQVLGVWHPAPNALVSRNTPINPTAIIDWAGTSSPGTNIATYTEIRSCIDSQLVYSSEGRINSVFPTGGIPIPLARSPSDLWNPVGLPLGCYRIVVKGSYDPVNDIWLEELYGDNEARSTFYLIETSHVNSGTSGGTMLSQNHPNPASSITNINFKLPSQGKVTLRIVDMTGRVYPLVTDKDYLSGDYSHTFDLNNLSAGIYFYELTFTDNKGEVQRLSKMMSIIK